MSEVEFKEWPPITRANPLESTITEKLNGTNSCVVIKDGAIVGVQSRRKFITPEDDNYGFAKWVWENEQDLLLLGNGRHYGEWAGPGIQKNPHRLDKKRFFLFNTYRWRLHRPKCCDVVPVLWQGLLEKNTIEEVMCSLREFYYEFKDPQAEPEGVVVYNHAFDKYTKHTFKNKEGKWKGE